MKASGTFIRPGCQLTGAFCRCFGLNFVIVVDCTQSMFIWEEKILVEKILPFYKSVDKSGGIFLMIDGGRLLLKNFTVAKRGAGYQLLGVECLFLL